MLNIKNPEADKLARKLAEKTGQSITNVVILALREKLLREQGKQAPIELKDALLEIGHRCATLPDKTSKPSQDIIDYDSSGAPT